MTKWSLIVLAACVHKTPAEPKWPDAKLELRDDADRDQVIDAVWATPVGTQRDALRAPVADALARRIGDALEEDRAIVAADLFEELASLWGGDVDHVGRGLASHLDLLRSLRATFAKAGALAPSAMALVLLAEVDAENKTAHLAELDELLGFADDLAVSENGPDAVRRQPIELLAPTVQALPLNWLVDRYVGLLVARQRSIQAALDKAGANVGFVRAHRDVATTSQHIASALARAGRPAEIHRQLVGLHGLGLDRGIAAHAEILATHPRPEAYVQLAAALRTDERAPDAEAALDICLVGLAAYPTDAGLLDAAANDARAIGRIDQPIRLFETAVKARKDDVDSTTALRLGKLYAERISRFALGGRPSEARGAWKQSLAFTGAQGADPVWQQAQAIAQASLGRGLLGNGLVHEAETQLEKSLERAPSIDAYESLATLALQTDDFAGAVDWVRAGSSILSDQTTGDRYRKAKLEQVAADAHRAARQPKAAAQTYLDALRTWASLGENKDLPRAIAAERLLATGRAMWWLGEKDKGVELVLKAVEADPRSSGIGPTAVAFLLEVGRPAEAIDAFHRVLGEVEIGELYKVYMALWLEGDARRRRVTGDRLAHEYLATRHGDVWYELLAEAATGRLDYAQLAAAATTGPRKGELAFYTATLALAPGDARKLLAQVVDSHLVMDAEYDLARVYLRK